jgi:hypothetical protein
MMTRDSVDHVSLRVGFGALGIRRAGGPAWRMLALAVVMTCTCLYPEHTWGQTTDAQTLPDASATNDDAGSSTTPVDTDFESKGGMQGECSIQPTYGTDAASTAKHTWWWVAIGGSAGALWTRRARRRDSSARFLARW